MKKTRIGNVELETPFLLAPMAGYTDSTFRWLCREKGAALTYGEMISAKGLVYGDGNTKNLLKVHEGEEPVGFQIFGRDPDFMAKATEILEPYPNVLLDINMGCPVPKIVRNGEGSALLREPELIYKIVKAVSSATDKPVTAKIRIGIEGAPEDAAILAAKAVEEGGGAAIGVHGRTREQYYSGKVNRDIISEIKQSLSIPVIGNGDISSYEGAMEMMEETGCDMVMIGRGALGNPWIFEELKARYLGLPAPKEPDLSERKAMIIKHYRDMEQVKGEYVAVREMRKFIPRYLKGVRGSAAVRSAVNSIISGAELCRIIEKMS